MPTGYTSGIQDGEIKTFREYALLCARAFGACITLRDDPLSSDIPEFTVGDYYVKRVETERAELEKLQAMTPEEIAKAYADFYANDDKWRIEANEKKEKDRAAYQAMLDEVRAFEPASDEHKGHRDFMIQQLTDSIPWDCGEPYELLKREPIGAWHANQIADKAKYLARAIESLEEERQRTESRNNWVRLLRESIDKHEAKKAVQSV